MRPAQIRATCQREADAEYQQLVDLNYEMIDGKLIRKGSKIEGNRYSTGDEFTLAAGATIHTEADNVYDRCIRRSGLKP